MPKIYSYQYVQIGHAALEILFVITLVLLICGFKNKNLASVGPPTLVKVVFPVLILLAAYLPLLFQSAILFSVIVPITILVGWVFVIAPLWRVSSNTGKNVAGILSYPGTFLIGGWPLTFAPGILALPFGWWKPAPFMTLKLKAIGNTKGVESSLILDSISLIFWISLFGFLIVYSFSKDKAK